MGGRDEIRIPRDEVHDAKKAMEISITLRNGMKP